ncbi:MAG: hypothetical protein JWO51_1660 [Rhodospirillales bacterium]|nr:hypothetical protein [Rhodospirillales bacterium]
MGAMARFWTVARASLVPMMLGVASRAGCAQDIDLHGIVQAGLVRTPGELGAADGGYGKLGQGGAGTRVQPEFVTGLIEATADLPWNLAALVDLQYGPKQKSPVDLTTAALHWQPAAQGAWRWSGKLGAFFPPFGLENRDIGWSSPWTLTPSALASWVGEELRAIGSEATVAWTGGDDSVALTAAVYGWNDPAGAVLAARGWDLGRQPIGLFDHVRLPNGPTPQYTPEFKEIDDTPGWYAGLTWQNAALGHLQLYRYDNQADPRADRHGVYAWRTRFWDAGYSQGFGPFYVILEGITGDTRISPEGNGPFVTDFHSAYLLGGWTRNEWRSAVRLEQFGIRGFAAEHGRSVTATLNYQPRDWLRLSAEVVVVDATSRARATAGLPARAIETEPQLGLQLSF